MKSLSLRRRFLVGVLALLCLVAYEPRRLENTSGDNISLRYWPVAILKHHTILLNPFSKDLAGVGFAAIYRGNDWIPRAELGTLAFTLPVYFGMDLLGLGGTEWTHVRIHQAARWDAFIFATLAVILLFLLLIRFSSDGVAFFSAALFAIGSYNWSVGAQGMSTQTAAVFLHMVALHLLWRLCVETRREALFLLAIAFGLLCGFGWATRPSMLFLLGAAVLLFRTPRVWVGFLVFFAAVVIPVVYFHEYLYFDPLGWRGVIAKLTAGSASDFMLQGSVVRGLTGIFFSPNRGAIVFFPLVFFVPYLWIRLLKPDLREVLESLRRFRIPTWSAKKRVGIPENFAWTLLLCTAAYLLVTCRMPDWHSTWSYGPRYFYDISPYLWPFLTLGVEEVRKFLVTRKSALPIWALGLFVLFALQCVFIQALGHRNYDLYLWNSKAPFSESRAWDYKDFMLKDVWNAGSNEGRWTDPLARLQRYGF